MIKNPRETVTIPVEVDRYILEAVPGRYFQLSSGGYVARVRKVNYWATMPDGTKLWSGTKSEIGPKVRAWLYRNGDKRQAVLEYTIVDPTR